MTCSLQHLSGFPSLLSFQYFLNLISVENQSSWRCGTVKIAPLADVFEMLGACTPEHRCSFQLVNVQIWPCMCSSVEIIK